MTFKAEKSINDMLIFPDNVKNRIRDSKQQKVEYATLQSEIKAFDLLLISKAKKPIGLLQEIIAEYESLLPEDI